MAILYPDYETITKLRQKPTNGELHLLKFLNNTLNNNYEVFFQPFLNGDLPDIIIMKQGAGVYIIEVKDWDLNLYNLDVENNNWYVETSNNQKQLVKSPLSQVFSYKNNMYNLHVEGLLEKKIKDYRALYIVNCGVYFHNASTRECNRFVTQNYNSKQIDKKSNKYLRFISFFDLFGRDKLRERHFMQIMKKRRMESQSYVFSNKLYKSFKRTLKPPNHIKEQGKDITYTEDQKRLIGSSASTKKKVKGVAGSGKTMCLAKRAVNAHKRHSEEVLILTYNIALRNYIRDKINEARENFSWKYFHIVHYHEFFKSQANNYGLKITGYGNWEDENFFESVKYKIKKYKTIIIDEVQDYRESWIKIILKYFLADGGEYVVFGDEKQNIYQIVYDKKEKKPYTKIGGRWNILKESFRVTNDIARLAENFQKEFFLDKYEIDEINTQKNIFEKSTLKYFYFRRFEEAKIISKYKDIASELGIHDNDICFQATNVKCLRSLDYTIRSQSGQKTNTMFETQEVYEKLYKDFDLDKDLKPEIRRKKLKKFEEEIEKVRRNKKFNFWNNPGTLKLSTIHSFKGWEVNTLFLLIHEDMTREFEKGGDGSHIENENLKFTTEELIYTAITRCRANLIIMNFSLNKYHEFFTAQNLMH